jgi:Flp pilus assembly protein TadD
MRAAWVISAALSLPACGGPEEIPREPLVADPPRGAHGATTGAADTELQRGVAYIKNERYEDAKLHLQQALELKPNSAEAAYYLGLAKEKTGDRPGAEAEYKKALAVSPGLIEAAMNLAALYLDDPPRPDEAIMVLSAAVAKAPDAADLYQNLAYAYGLKKDVANASKAYDTAIAKGGDRADVHLAYGVMLVEAKALDRAAVELKKALAGAGDDAAMLATIGRMLGPAKAYGDCVAAFDRAIKLKPELPELYVRRGTCRHELKDEEGARADYEAAIKVDPKFAAAHYYLGLSWLADRKRRRAYSSMEQAARHGRGTEIGKRAREKMREIGPPKP